MKVLWLCNIIPPIVARKYNRNIEVKEGWISGLIDLFVADKSSELELALCVPAKASIQDKKTTIQIADKTIYVFFFEEKDITSVGATEEQFRKILNDYKPDVVHCFGTEYAHTLAMIRAFSKPERTLISIQGLISEYAKCYRSYLPDRVWHGRSFRDVLKRDSLIHQQQLFERRGANEIEAIKQKVNIAGRTEWDYRNTNKWNPEAKYFILNENLRECFYEGAWDYNTCEKYSLFISQGDYPIKGLHFVLEATSQLVKQYPNIRVYVAGKNITSQQQKNGLIAKLKRNRYGQYLDELIRRNHLKSNIIFLGNLSDQEMKKQYLNCNAFICPSVIENSPNSVGEAMILGTPVICANAGGIPSIFEKEIDGTMYENGNVLQLVEAIDRVFRYEDDIKKMSGQARIHAMTTHNREYNYTQLVETYRTIWKAK